MVIGAVGRIRQPESRITATRRRRQGVAREQRIREQWGERHQALGLLPKRTRQIQLHCTVVPLLQPRLLPPDGARISQRIH